MTTLLQIGIVALSSSVALLADTVHNVGDTLNSVPLLIAFYLARRVATRRYTYGFGRAEDVAGIFIVLSIAFSAGVVFWESFQKLLNPQPMQNIPSVAVAAIIGFIGNEAVALLQIRTGRKIGSDAMIADGAALRHQLYTLALTHFQAVYTNYFDRPELHKLHNRSGELWSPLVALAAFFEEQGGVVGLLDAISDAAEWDEQISEGKSLSEREEAVLQALALLTRSADEIVWVKGTDLRERFRSLLGQSVDEMGNAQWIGHILKRLQLVDNSRRKHHVGGKVYAIDRREVLDMIQRYDVRLVENEGAK